MPGKAYGKPCDLVENWLRVQEQGSSISRGDTIFCGDEGLLDYLAFNSGIEPEDDSLGYHSMESLEEFKMTSKQREAIQMYFFDNKRIAQIATELNISSEAVLERIKYGKARILKQLNRRLLFKEYIEGRLISDVFAKIKVKNIYLAKLVVEAYFIDCEETAKVPGLILEKHGIETTLGTVYKYVNVVKDFIDDILTKNTRVSEEHKKALTDFTY
jgi:predicted DNA-binding protein YlxM (UPF0122 family)